MSKLSWLFRTVEPGRVNITVSDMGSNVLYRYVYECSEHGIHGVYDNLSGAIDGAQMHSIKFHRASAYVELNR